jgi:putative nucleotidyltransferase with HDIG domain
VIEKKVDIDDLRIGAYVSRLDRAWVDTPFMFQGFYIHNSNDIEALREHCKYVYIDVNREPLNKEPLQTLDYKTPAANIENLRAAMPRRKVNYQNTISVERELKHAKISLHSLTNVIDSIVTDVENNRPINLQNAEGTIKSMIESIARNPDAYVWLSRIQNNNEYTYHHAMDVAILALSLGRHLGLSIEELHELAIGTLLFDIGKLKLPPNLLKKPGKLTADEFALVKKHVEFGVEILESIDGMPVKSVDIAKYHHERHNGKGYPEGLKGTHIPVYARIASIADCYCAITRHRSYSPAVSSHEAIKQMYEWSGLDFQPEMIEQFIQCLGIYPTGSLVELSSGEVGAILSQNRVRRLRPKVMLILDNNKVAYDHFPVIDLVKEKTDKDGNPLEIVATHEPGAFGIDPKSFYL